MNLHIMQVSQKELGVGARKRFDAFRLFYEQVACVGCVGCIFGPLDAPGDNRALKLEITAD